MTDVNIGPYAIDPPLVLAPMAGVTDRAFRRLCKRGGAGLVVSEMISANPKLWHTKKSRTRREHDAECGPIAVQIAGTEPQAMAEAARFNVDQGAQIIDINMGCPAKKVCRVDAGSALMKDEALVGRILDAVANAVPVPVTLKMRSGWSPEHRNAPRIARIAQDAGIAAVSVHGRTRADLFKGAAEYRTIAEVKSAVDIPVIANGDICDGPKAQDVLRQTGADALMIGRAALGRPWLFAEIAHYLQHGAVKSEPSRQQIGALLLEHLKALYALYGEHQGVRVARKHIQWYCQHHRGSDAFWKSVRQVQCPTLQFDQVSDFFAANDSAAC